MLATMQCEIHGKRAGASLRGEQTPGASRVLWQSNNYDCFARRSIDGIQSEQANPAQSRLQLTCQLWIGKQATSVFI
jgi:hypothetical protein